MLLKLNQLSRGLREHVWLGLQLAALSRLVARRRRTGLTNLLVGLSAPLLALAAYAAYDLGSQLSDRLAPVQAVGAGLALGVGLAAWWQLKALSAANWPTFLARMPVPATAIVFLQMSASILPTLAYAFLLLSFSTGLGGAASAQAMFLRVGSACMAVVWMSALAALAIQLLIRLQSVRRVWALIAALAAALAVLAAAWRGLVPAAAAEFVATEIGLRPLADPMAGVPMAARAVIADWMPPMAVSALALAVAAWRTRVPSSGSAVTERLWGTGWLRPMIALIPGDVAAQISLEWLRTLRSRAPLFQMLVIGACLLALATRGELSSAGESTLMAGLLCLFLTSYAVKDIKRRSPRGAYWVFGVRTRDFLAGTTSSTGAAIGVACAAVFILGASRIPLLTEVGAIAAASALVGALLLHPLAGLDHDLECLFRNSPDTPVRNVITNVLFGLPFLLIAWLVFIGMQAQPLTTLAVSLGLAFAALRRPSFDRIATLYWSEHGHRS